MTNREDLDKIDAALSIGPQSSDQSTAYPIIKELRDHYKDSLESLIIQEKQKSQIDIELFRLLQSLAERAYPEKKQDLSRPRPAGTGIGMIAVTARKQLRKIIGLPPLTVAGQFPREGR
ncbi:MAG TPA: hypothetical protein VKC66_20960 [Xanthobacteraceae bacterium]|nr:hypothetical protein [Xanthobacteraceae bacterium]